MQSELGDVVYVELPEVGTTYEKSDGFGVVESVKTASDVYVPVGGEVVEANQALVDEPAKVPHHHLHCWFRCLALPGRGFPQGHCHGT